MNVATNIVSCKKHSEQVRKIYLGFKKLNNTYGHLRLDITCRRALALDCFSFKSILSILEKGLDKQPFVVPICTATPPDHDNLCGSQYYCQST